jgi:branched-chain amino acid transport system ATP-binding protein
LPDSPSPLLRVEGLVAGYGPKEVLRGVHLEVSTGEIVVLLGHNGAGKSTVLRAIFGLIPARTGEVCFKGRAVTGLCTRDLIALGIGLVPQGGRVFTELTVQENFKVAGTVLISKALLAARILHVLSIFPQLGPLLHRKAAKLSGGERQMVAVANGLIPAPSLLLLDEPSLGLAPALAETMFQRIRDIALGGVGILMVEQRVREALRWANRASVLRNGQVVYNGSATNLLDGDNLREVFL